LFPGFGLLQGSIAPARFFGTEFQNIANYRPEKPEYDCESIKYDSGASRKFTLDRKVVSCSNHDASSPHEEPSLSANFNH
jgi:hypothetical protein